MKSQSHLTDLVTSYDKPNFTAEKGDEIASQSHLTDLVTSYGQFNDIMNGAFGVSQSHLTDLVTSNRIDHAMCFPSIGYESQSHLADLVNSDERRAENTPRSFSSRRNSI